MSDDWVMAAPHLGNVDERRRRFDRGLVVAVVSFDEETGEFEVMLHPEFVRRDNITVATGALAASRLFEQHEEFLLEKWRQHVAERDLNRPRGRRRAA